MWGGDRVSCFRSETPSSGWLMVIVITGTASLPVCRSSGCFLLGGTGHWGVVEKKCSHASRIVCQPRSIVRVWQPRGRLLILGSSHNCSGPRNSGDHVYNWWESPAPALYPNTPLAQMFVRVWRTVPTNCASSRTRVGARG